MARKKTSSIGYLIIGVIAIFFAVGQFIFDNIWIIAFVLFVIICIVAIVLVVKSKKKSLPQDQEETEKTTEKTDDVFSNFPSNAMTHFKSAQDAESKNDYLGARVSFMACVDLLKRDESNKEQFEFAKKEYSAFVRRDPIFNKLLPFFIDGIRQNPGIIQSDITAKAEEKDWAELRNYNRSISKDDIRYVFYFAEEFGLLIRKKEGRSYRLYLPEQLKDVTEGKE